MEFKTGNELNNDNELKTISNLEYDKMQIKQNITFKAETHNFPTAISPFPAAETGVGGRIRDTVSILWYAEDNVKNTIIQQKFSFESTINSQCYWRGCLPKYWGWRSGWFY